MLRKMSLIDLRISAGLFLILLRQAFLFFFRLMASQTVALRFKRCETKY